jgi:hypothetical protein
MYLSNEMIETIGQQNEEACRLLLSLHDNGDLSVDQYDPISRALLGNIYLRKEVAQLRSIIVAMREGGHELPGSLFQASLEWSDK